MPEFAPIDIPQGPLITPHTPNITGAEWPKLEDAGAGIVAAAAKGAEINGRVRSMESRLLAMQLEEKNKDIEHGLAVQRMAQQAGEFQQNMLLKDKAVNSLAAERDWKERKYYDTLDDLGKYSSALSSIDLSDPTAWNQAMTIKSEHPEGANTPGGRRMEFYVGDQYNKRTAAQKTAAASDLKQIDTYLKNWNWQGFRPTSEPLDNPSYWQPAYKMNPDNTVAVDEKGNKIIDPTTKTYLLGTDQLGKPHYLTQPTAVIDDYLSRWQRAKNAMRKDQVTDPTLNLHPYPVDPTAGGGNMQYGTEEQARQAGHQSGETVTVYNPRSGQYEPYKLH